MATPTLLPVAKPTLNLKLLVDEKKNKVVLAEASKDFVDVLFSFLMLPVGTIVRLLEKYQQDQKSLGVTIGCLNNLYNSVFDLGMASFMTEACKKMLLYPRTEKGRMLKVTIDDTKVSGFYVCPKGNIKSLCPDAYSDFPTSRCSCGALMEDGHTRSSLACEEIFVSDKTLFTITDNMKVVFTSMGLTLKTLKDQGYTDVDQLQEIFVDVDREKFLALLHCLFSSDTPLSDVFLMKRSSCTITKTLNIQSLALQEETAGGKAHSDKVMSVSVFTRKLDKKVIYVESGKDFVDLLFTFLVLPLNCALEFSGSILVQGCIGNLLESFKSLRSSDERNALTDKCMLPWYYSCQQPLLDVYYAGPQKDLRIWRNYDHRICKPIDPRCDKIAGSEECSGFVKRGTTFMVSDDLIITPMNLSANICSLKKWNLKFDEIEEQVINISKVEAIRLLGASFMTSTALTTVFGSLLLKKPKEEKL